MLKWVTKSTLAYVNINGRINERMGNADSCNAAIFRATGSTHSTHTVCENQPVRLLSIEHTDNTRATKDYRQTSVVWVETISPCAPTGPV